MSSSEPPWRHPDFRRGAVDMAEVSVGLATWGLVTGMAMVKSGLDLPLALFMSFTVFAGSAQLTSLPLIASGAPIWVVWAASACVNLRFVILSAQWRPYFAHLPRAQRLRVGFFCADLNYVLFMRRFPEPKPGPGQLPYFWGGLAVNFTCWQGGSVAGMLLADRIPPQWGLGFAGALALLGITFQLITDRITLLAAVVAGAAAVAAYALPLKLNIVVAIASAVALGVIVDHVRAARERAARGAS